MSVIKDFLNNPIKFMNNNIVSTPNLKTKTYGRAQALKFELQPFPAAKNEQGKTVPHYRLKSADDDDQGFNSYICDYEQGQINYQVLGEEANFVFTWTMNGCTFGIGHNASDGSLIVSHGNSANAERGDMTQIEAQRAWARGFHGDSVKLFEPAAYRPEGSNRISTTFGVKKNGQWKFYSQGYEQKSGVITLYGCSEIAGSKLTN